MKLRNYVLVTAGYWAFTVTDGALRMLVLLYFHELGYSAVSIALLFLLYELMGVVTNLLGGWVGARSGLNVTLRAGLALQVVALAALTAHDPGWSEVVSVGYVMGLQALSGVAKDLTKMSSKSAVKYLASEGSGRGGLFNLVAVLTGSKNALKGVGFFVGSLLLARLGYDGALWALAGLVAVALVAVLVLLTEDIGRASVKPGLASILAKSSAINRLSAARLFLFASRDIWFVVALPVFLSEVLGWSFTGVGAFMAAWVIGYGIVQSATPTILRGSVGSVTAEVAAARRWVAVLLGVSAVLTLGVWLGNTEVQTVVIVGGLVVFGVVFAVNSSLHSYLVLAFADGDGVSLDVGFYYSANAAGRLIGTLASGLLYLWGGLVGALIGSTASVAFAWSLSRILPSGAPELDSEATGPSATARRPGSDRT